MLKIMIAGSGCFLGKCMLVGTYKDAVITAEAKDESPENVYEGLTNLFDKVNVDFEERIELGVDPLFTRFYHLLVRAGYKNVTRVNSDPVNAAHAHKFFEKSLHELGVNTAITCVDLDYNAFHYALLLEVAINPDLDAHIKETFTHSKQYVKFMEKVDTIRRTCAVLVAQELALATKKEV